MIFERMLSESVEELVFIQDPAVGLEAVVAIHSSLLGPALGGCRIWSYGSELEAVNDVVRLAKGMTYKAALAGLKLGGGKAVIWKRSHFPEEGSTQWKLLLERVGERVQQFSGRYLTAKDVGMSAAGLQVIRGKTPYVFGIKGLSGSSGDPSPLTARGVYGGILAAANLTLGQKSLKGLRIALQGLGSVSWSLLEYLVRAEAKVIGCDLNPNAVKKAVDHYGIQIVEPEEIYDVDCEIFSPSALGGILNSRTIPRLKTQIVAGAANNQLADPEMDGDLLRERRIVYVPDYVINAGGLINICYEAVNKQKFLNLEEESLNFEGYDQAGACAHVDRIAETVFAILSRAQEDNLSPHRVADQMVLEKLSSRSIRQTTGLGLNSSQDLMNLKKKSLSAFDLRADELTS